MIEEPVASISERIEGLAGAARAWRHPDHAARAEAVEQTLAATERFTPEALAFAVNAAMHRLTPEALRSWIGDRRARGACTVGVLNAGGAPLSGLRDLLAVLLLGHRYLGVASSEGCALLPAFAEELRRRWKTAPALFAEDEKALFAQADALLGSGKEEARTAFAQRADAAGIAETHRRWWTDGFAVAVLDGEESAEECEGLAEDALLYAGHGERSVRVVWAPAGLAPDAYLEAMAHFRAVFPPPPALAGALEMQRAFLEAQSRPYAHGEGLEFLMSRGAPELQPPGHLRWAEYETLDEVRAGPAGAPPVCLLVARAPVAERLAADVPRTAPGTAHRPPLETPRATETLAFLADLGG